MNTADPQNPNTRRAKVNNSALRRAALVLVSLDDAQAAELLRQLPPEQVEAITKAVENLHEIDPHEQAEALREFQKRLQPAPAGPSTTGSARRVEQPTLLPEDPTRWDDTDIQASFELGLTELWAIALADCDLETVEHVHQALIKPDRKRLQAVDRVRGPWRLDEPQIAREKIHREYQNFLKRNSRAM